jgi:sec-independent protein translocase protein TatC
MNKKDTPKSFWNHIEEFRRRFLRVLSVLSLLFIGCVYKVDPVINTLSKITGVPFVYTQPTEAFFIRLKIAFMMAFFLCIPLIIFEVWKFVGVALTVKERHWMMGVLPASYLLFCLGVAISWFVVLPSATKFLMSFSTAALQPLLSIDGYISFAMWMTLAFGGLFQLPLGVLFLVRMDIVDPKTLSHYRPHVVAGLALLSAFLTPGGDPFSQLALLIPSYLLFEISLLVARFLCKPTVVGEEGEAWNPE